MNNSIIPTIEISRPDTGRSCEMNAKAFEEQDARNAANIEEAAEAYEKAYYFAAKHPDDPEAQKEASQTCEVWSRYKEKGSMEGDHWDDHIIKAPNRAHWKHDDNTCPTDTSAVSPDIMTKTAKETYHNLTYTPYIPDQNKQTTWTGTALQETLKSEN